MKDLININRLNLFGQNIWSKIKNTFMTKNGNFISTSIFTMLEVGETIAVATVYEKDNTYNNICLNGFVQYLE